MIQHSGRNLTAGDASPTSNQRQQQRLFNRMSGFLFQKRQDTPGQENYPSPSSSTATPTLLGAVTTLNNGESPLLDEDDAPRVDSMFSTLPSTNSTMHVNHNTPPPLRTVRLDGGIVHQPGAPPTPPRRTTSQPISPLSISDNSTTMAQPEDFDQAFEKMAHEYGLPNDVARTLSLEAKQVLLRNSQANNLQQNNSNNGFFSWRTWGIQRKQKQHVDVRQDRFFYPSTSTALSSPATDPSSSNNNNVSRQMAYSTSARHRPRRTSIMTFTQGSHNNSTRRTGTLAHRNDRHMKKRVSSPEYFIHLLKDCHIRDLEESQVQDLRVCLRSVKASWTTQFLQLGGYTVLSNLFYQMNHAPKRSPNDDKMLQHLAKCFKAIMTHEQAGVAIVLTNPVGLGYIRDLLFGQVDQKQRSLYSLSVTTRAHFLNILCTLANLQTTQSETVPYIHGYDVLRRLLLDCPETTKPVSSLSSTTVPNSNNSVSTDNMDDQADTDAEFPFRMTLKEDPQDIMKLIFEDDPFYNSGQVLKPRYTAWMRELQYTVEKEIEPITFLAQVLDYKFESAFRQLRIKSPPTSQQDLPGAEQELGAINQEAAAAPEEGTGNVMVDDGVVEYLIAHLRLINTIVATQPTFQKTTYDDRGREKVRMEVMMSGFDKIAKALQCCPHPTLYAFYFRYLQPLLQPLATIHPSRSPSHPTTTTDDTLINTRYDHTSSSTLPTRDGMLQWEDEVRQASSSGILFEQPPWADDSFYEDDDDSDNYEDYESEEEMEPFHYYDDEDVNHNDHDDDDDDDDLGITSVRDHEHRWKMGAAVAR
ncbi:armadillo-type protein [Chlamydoabsidia padenii]|nr:armadillo-type protein [Chlamydoabsidia padenii]